MSHRRYRVGLNPAYDSTFDNYKERSGILNRGQAGVSSVTFDLWSETGIRKLLDEWTGTEDGMYDTGHSIVNSRLKDAEERLAAVDTRFENQKTMAVRAGRYPVEVMPQAMVQEKLTLEARLDIIREEIDWLKKELPKFKAQEQHRDEHLILASGPAGSTAGADPPRSVDGQPVRWDEAEGSFIIRCPKSPYDGLKLQNYYAFVCKPWRDAKQAAYRKEHAISQNFDLPQGERQRAAERAWRILRSATDPPWPERPEGS